MWNLTQDQAMNLFDSINGFLFVFAFVILIVRIVFVVLLFVLVIKAIQYFHNKNKGNCASCVYKQNYKKRDT